MVMHGSISQRESNQSPFPFAFSQFASAIFTHTQENGGCSNHFLILFFFFSSSFHRDWWANSLIYHYLSQNLRERRRGRRGERRRNSEWNKKEETMRWITEKRKWQRESHCMKKKKRKIRKKRWSKLNLEDFSSIISFDYLYRNSPIPVLSFWTLPSSLYLSITFKINEIISAKLGKIYKTPCNYKYYWKALTDIWDYTNFSTFQTYLQVPLWIYYLLLLLQTF